MQEPSFPSHLRQLERLSSLHLVTIQRSSRPNLSRVRHFIVIAILIFEIDSGDSSEIKLYLFEADEEHLHFRDPDIKSSRRPLEEP